MTLVPCYNEGKGIEIFFNELYKELQRTKQSFEVMFIDDGSWDCTLEVIKRMASIYSEIKYLAFTRNFGKESAIYAGLSNSRGKYTVIMDADLQDPPELLPIMYDVIIGGQFDCVATYRKNRLGEPPIRSFFSKIFYVILRKISRLDIKDGARDYRIMTRCMVDTLSHMGEHNRFSKGLFSWCGFRTQWIPFENRQRVVGTTKWSFFKLLKYAIEGIMNFSQLPLYFASYLGIGMTIFSIAIMIVIVIRQLLLKDAVEGWTSLVCIFMFIGGLQLFCIGIMGQYLAKIFLETKNRPHYVINETNVENIKET